MELNQNQNQNAEEKGSSINSNFGKRKTLYIVNFTPIRLLVFALSSTALILFVFIIGFHLGGSKPVQISNNSDDSISALMRNAQDTENMITERSSVDMPNGDFTALSEYDAVNNNSIIREGNTSADRYNEYTQNLASELDAINKNIKEKDTAGLTPNTTYTPPQQMASIEPIKPSPANNIGGSTRVPYTRSSSADSIYFIQVAVGYDKDNTYSARDSIKTKFPKAFIKEEAMSDGKMMYKLKIGRYETREEAQKALSEIKKIPAYKDSYIYSDKKSS